MTHPDVRPDAAARLAGAAPPPPLSPVPPTGRARLKALVKKVAAPLVGRVSDQAAARVRPEVDAARGDVEALREELAATRRELEAEIELLRAELDGGDRGATDLSS